MEQWNAYDKHGHQLDTILTRGKPIPKGMYHLVGEVLVCHTDQTYLITKRSAQKTISPLCWEASAGGSAMIGESALDAAKRELLEECGIAANHWYELGRFTDDETQTHYVGFLCIYDQAKTNIKLQKEETIAYDWISERCLKELVNTNQYAKTHQKRLLFYLNHCKENT